MSFEHEVQEQYLKAYGKGTSDQRKSVRQGGNANLQVLEKCLDQKQVAYKIDLGVMEIPVSQIVGIAAADGRELLYTSDFIPLSSPKSSFAKAWCQLYMEYLSDKGLMNPIRCFEYLGQFYVEDGVKRVSVVKNHGAAVISSQIIRIMPRSTTEKSIQCYYEFLHHFRLTRLYQVSFTKPENFARLQAALGHEVNYRWNDMDRFGFLFYWHTIESAFQKAYDGGLHITAADALIVLLENYTYSQIIKMPVWVLTRVFQACWKELYAISISGNNPQRNQLTSGNLQTA